MIARYGIRRVPPGFGIAYMYIYIYIYNRIYNPIYIYTYRVGQKYLFNFEGL